MSTSAEFHRMVSDYEEKIADLRAELAALRTQLADSRAMHDAAVKELEIHERECCTRSGARGSLPDDAEEQIANAMASQPRLANLYSANPSQYMGPGGEAATVLNVVRSWLSPAAPTAAEESREICTCPGIVTPIFGGEVCMRCARPFDPAPAAVPAAAEQIEDERNVPGTSRWCNCQAPNQYSGPYHPYGDAESCTLAAERSVEPAPAGASPDTPEEPKLIKLQAKINEAIERRDEWMRAAGSSETTSEPATENDHCEKTITIEGRTYRCVRRVLHLGEHEYHEPETTSGPTPSGEGYKPTPWDARIGLKVTMRSSPHVEGTICGIDRSRVSDIQVQWAGAVFTGWHAQDDLIPAPAENTEGSEQT